MAGSANARLKGQSDSRIQKSLLIFYGLVCYVFIQFAWWTYLLYDLNSQVLFLHTQVEQARGLHPDLKALQQLLFQKRAMILGEALVFILLLMLGIVQTRKTFKREAHLALQQHNFLLSVTHELKSPLAAVKLFLQTIAKRELARDKQIELSAKALEESQRLDQLIENILLLNRMESPEFALQREVLNLSETVAESIERYKAIVPAPFEWVVHIEQKVFANVDIQAINSILSNLFENAWNYAGKGKYIRVEVLNEKSDAVIRVSDKGPGIPDEEKNKVFNRFYRSGSEDIRKTKGTGLGLFIVRNLIRSMNGRILIKDNQPHGCTFEIRFKTSI